MSSKSRGTKKWRFICRDFLNDPQQDWHTKAYFIGRVENTASSRMTTDITPTVSFELSDCVHSITLWFDMHSKPGIENSRYKIRKLMKLLGEFAEALELELDLREQRLDAREAAKKTAKREQAKVADG